MSKEIETWYAKVLKSCYIISGIRCNLQNNWETVQYVGTFKVWNI